ncbi:MAG: hypothetical protein WD010_05050 [Nitriliruptor sp.]
MSVRDDEVRDDSTSFEVERHTDDQPPRGDLVEPDDIAAAEDTDELQGSPNSGGLDEGAGRVDDPDPFQRDDEPPRAGASPDDLPESQGFDADVADQLTEDGGSPALDAKERAEP